MVLSSKQDGFVVEEIIEFSAVYLVEGKPDFYVVTILQLFENVLRCEKVQSSDWASISKHSVGFSAACLTVGEASDFSSIEGAIDERSDSSLVNLDKGRLTYSLVAY